MAPGSSSRSAASVRRQSVRNAIGGSPTSSVKRRASAAREAPTSAASPATVHGWAGLLWSMRTAPARRRGRRWPGTSPGAAASGAGEPGPQGGDEQQVEEAVEDGVLPRLVARPSRPPAGRRAERRARRPGRRGAAGGAPSSRAPTSPSRVVRADELDVAAVADRCPTPARRASISCFSSTPSGVVQRWPGWMTACGRRRRVVARTCRGAGRGSRRRRRRRAGPVAAVGDDPRRCRR